MAFFETVVSLIKDGVDALGGLKVGEVSLYTLADVGLILAIGLGVVFIGKKYIGKYFLNKK